MAIYQNWFFDLLTTMVMKFPKMNPQFTVTTTPGEHSSKCLPNENYNIQGCNLSLWGEGQSQKIVYSKWSPNSVAYKFVGEEDGLKKHMSHMKQQMLKFPCMTLKTLHPKPLQFL